MTPTGRGPRWALHAATGGTTTVRAFGRGGELLAEELVTQTDLRPSANPEPTTFDAEELGAIVEEVEIDNPGSAGNPPYVTAIDGFNPVAVEPGRGRRSDD